MTALKWYYSMGIRVRIKNDSYAAGISDWLASTIGYGNWTEYIGIIELPYRSYELHNPEHVTLFLLTWKDSFIVPFD